MAQDDSINFVLLSIPLKVIPALLPSLDMHDWIILSTSNYCPIKDGIEPLQSHELTTCEYITQDLNKSNKLVKVFNNIESTHITVNATKDTSKQTTLPIDGDGHA